MNSKKRVVLLSVVCLFLVGLCAVVHLTTRDNVPEGAIAIEADGKTAYVDMNSIELEAVEGEVVNGKGETKTVSGEGALVKDILSENNINVGSGVKVVSDDEYSAEIEKAELEEAGKAYIIVEDNSARLYVFGDSNSKRNVSNVVKIVVE